ncbi:anti-repressor SinI family protein [Bacillus sp. SD075]|nr:anti-repressor SinI family protein [Bacillus sp. SD075]
MKENNIDEQWLLLIMEAREIGLTPKEIRSFLSIQSNGEIENLNGHSHSI